MLLRKREYEARTSDPDEEPKRAADIADFWRPRVGSDPGSRDCGTTLAAQHHALSLLMWLLRARLPRPIAVVVALMLGCFLIGVIVVVSLSSINELAANSTKYTERVHAMINWLIQWGGVLGIDISKKEITEKILNYTPFLSEMLLKSISMIFEEMSNGFLMILFTVYLLIGYNPRSGADKRLSGVRAEIDNQVRACMYAYIYLCMCACMYACVNARIYLGEKKLMVCTFRPKVV